MLPPVAPEPDVRDETDMDRGWLPGPATEAEGRHGGGPGPDETDGPPPEEPGASPRASEQPPPRGVARAVVRTFGEVLITLGVVVLLFVVYELYVTNLMSAELQKDASADLDERWSQERELHADPLDGEAFARIYIPSFGMDWNFTVQQGVDNATLEIGPGHYKDTAMPGERGNFSVAGHRVGKGAPFNDLDLLTSCDAVVVETGASFYVYRVLPMRDELEGWSEGKGADPRCAGVGPLDSRDEAYAETVGRRIVLPGRGDAVAPVPYRPDAGLPEEKQAELLTMTTCHPRFSDRERMIIHGVLTQVYEKKDGAGYTELLHEIGEV